MQKEKLDAKKILENCTIIFLFFVPVFSTIFFYNRITTLIEVICVFLINLFTLLFYKNSRNNYKWLFIYYLLCMLYLVLSYNHSLSFKSLVPNNFNYNIVSEALTVIKLITPITLLYSLYYQKIPFKKYMLVLKVWTLFISGTIIITNIFKISLGSYTDSFISKNIFEWNTKNYYQDTASKGFFMYANQCAVSLILLLLLFVYDFLYNNKKSIIYIIFLTTAMLMLGTRISTIGGLLTLFCVCVFYLIYKLIRKEKIDKKLDYWLDRFEIKDYKFKKIKELSKGNQQKIQFISAVINEPKLLILDEPFTGLDPINVGLLKDAVKDLQKNGCSIIFSSHQMEYIEDFCEELIILVHGKAVINGNLNEIKENYAKKNIQIKGDNIPVEKLEKINGVEEVEEKANEYVVHIKDASVSKEVFDVIKNFNITKYVVADASLNEIFIHYVGGKNE